MRYSFRAAPLIAALALPATAEQGSSLIERAAKLAQESCTVSTLQGSRRTDDGRRVIALPDGGEEIELSRENWNGIQQVLREHQQKESENYRDCVRDLTARFLEAERQQQARTNPEQNLNNDLPRSEALCEYENDGFCDVPGDCPWGTDLADCAFADQNDTLFPTSQPLYCCDYIYHQKWCLITTGDMAPGLPCVCAGVAGSGYQCY